MMFSRRQVRYSFIVLMVLVEACMMYSCPSSITLRLVLLLAAPMMFSRRQVNTPLSSAQVLVMVSVELVSVVRIWKSLESFTGKLYLYHFTAGFGWPLNWTMKLAVSPSLTVRGSRDFVKLGASMFAMLK